MRDKTDVDFDIFSDVDYCIIVYDTPDSTTLSCPNRRYEFSGSAEFRFVKRFITDLLLTGRNFVTKADFSTMQIFTDRYFVEFSQLLDSLSSILSSVKVSFSPNLPFNY